MPLVRARASAARRGGEGGDPGRARRAVGRPPFCSRLGAGGGCSLSLPRNAHGPPACASRHKTVWPRCMGGGGGYAKRHSHVGRAACAIGESDFNLREQRECTDPAYEKERAPQTHMASSGIHRTCATGHASAKQQRRARHLANTNNSPSLTTHTRTRCPNYRAPRHTHARTRTS